MPGLDRDRQVRQRERHPLVAPDRRAEGHAGLRVPRGQVQAGPGRAERERADRDPAVVEDGEELLEAGPPLAEEVVLGHPAAAEGQAVGVGGVPAELAVGLLDDEAVGAGRDRDGTDLRRAVPPGPRAGGHRDDAGDLGPGVGDVALGAVDDPLAVGQLRLGPRGPGVGAGLGLGEAERGQRTTLHQVGQPPLALGVGAVGEDRVDAQADARAQRDPGGLVDVAELLDRDAQAGEVTAGPAVGLGHDE